MSGRPEIVSATEALALRLFGAGMEMDDDQAAEDFYRQPLDMQRYWLRVAHVAVLHAQEMVAGLQGVRGETVAELERAIVKLVLLMPAAVTVPHLGKVT